MAVRSSVTLILAVLAACRASPQPVLAPILECPKVVAAPADTQVYEDTLSLTVRPSRIYSPPLHYPDSLGAIGVEGHVVLDLIIDASGLVEPTSLRVVSATHRDFVAPSIEVALKSEFCPGIHSGHPVRTRNVLPINFWVRPG